LRKNTSAVYFPSSFLTSWVLNKKNLQSLLMIVSPRVDKIKN